MISNNSLINTTKKTDSVLNLINKTIYKQKYMNGSKFVNKCYQKYKKFFQILSFFFLLIYYHQVIKLKI